MITKITEIKQVREELKKITIELKKKIIRGQEITIDDIKRLEEKI